MLTFDPIRLARRQLKVSETRESHRRESVVFDLRAITLAGVHEALYLAYCHKVRQ
jgi:hypothetical protein